VKSEKLGELVADTAEFATDMMLHDGVMKDIPIFGTLVKAYQAASHIKEGLFARKIYKFLSQIGSLSSFERTKVIDEISTKKGGINAAGATITGLLEKIDDEQKPEFVGRLFIACAKGIITVNAFLKLANIVSNLYIDDIKNLCFVEGGYEFTSEEKNSYAAYGLMLPSIKKPINFSDGISLGALGETIFDKGLELEYKFTMDAKLIAEICLDVKISKTADLSNFLDV
jgi:hypothetical protein